LALASCRLRAVPEPTAEPGSAAAVAATLASLRAAVMQRQGELAAIGGSGDDLAASLAELRRHEFVQEPRPVSPRPGLGRIIVFVRRAVYHLFAKWHARAVLQQQNEFNQAAAALISTLAERERAGRAEIARLARRLDELEAANAARAGTPE
jgi:hypothetical protein